MINRIKMRELVVVVVERDFLNSTLQLQLKTPTKHSCESCLKLLSSYCRRAALAGSYSHALVHRKDEDLSVADVSRACAFDDRLYRLFDVVVVYRDGETHLLVKRDFLHRATIHVDVSALLSAAKCVCDGHLVYLAGE